MNGIMATCVYCLASVAKTKITDDHVIAKSWYPEHTPANLERWKVPCCSRCNAEFGRVEEDILVLIAHCLDPRDPKSAHIVAKARRSIDPECGVDEPDRAARKRRRVWFLRHCYRLDALPDHGVLPSFEKSFAMGSRLGIRMNGPKLNAVVSKWTRGIHFWHCSRLIRNADSIQIFHVKDAVADTAFEKIKNAAEYLNRGEGIQIMRAEGRDDSGAMTLYAFNIWNQFKTYSAVEENH